MIGFLIALGIVGIVRTTAFRGTDGGAFIVDIILLIGLTALLNSGC